MVTLIDVSFVTLTPPKYVYECGSNSGQQICNHKHCYKEASSLGRARTVTITRLPCIVITKKYSIE